jgi:hypothetical protein
MVTSSKGSPKRRASSAPATAGPHVSGRSPFAALRSSSAESTPPGLLIATLRIRIPKDIWTGPFSARHPSVRLEVLNRTDLSADTSVSDYWISGQPPGLWVSEISTYGDVLSVESLAEVGDGCIYRVTYQNPPVVYQYRRLSLPLQFPLKIHAGTLTWEVIGRRADFEEILQFAKSRDPNLQVISIRHRGLRSHLPFLTPSQQQLLTDAMSAGYFAVPRGVTLTALARRLGRSKSAVSEGLAIIEKKLLETALRPTTLLP